MVGLVSIVGSYVFAIYTDITSAIRVFGYNQPVMPVDNWQPPRKRGFFCPFECLCRGLLSFCVCHLEYRLFGDAVKQGILRG